MREYQCLSENEKKKVVSEILNELVESVLERRLMFDDQDNADNFQLRIDEAVAKAARDGRPWLAGDYVMGEVGEELKSMAASKASEYIYPQTLASTTTLNS